LLFRVKVEKAFVEHSNVSEFAAHLRANVFDFGANFSGGFLGGVILHRIESDYMMTTLLLSSTLIFTLLKDFLRGVEHFARRGTFLWNIFGVVEHFRETISWNNFGVVEHFRGTFRASWNNPARPGCGTFSTSWNIFVEHFPHRGTFLWNNFHVVEHSLTTRFF
jgi:hypothetical protein